VKMRASLFCGMLISVLSVAISVNPIKASDLQDLSLQELIEHKPPHEVYAWVQKHPLSVGHEVNWKDNRGVPRTGNLLQWAIAQGHMPLIQYLRLHGFSFSESWSYRDSALSLSARSGDIETFRYVLQQGADPFADRETLTLVLGDLVYGGTPDLLAFFLHEERSQSRLRQAMLTQVLSQRVEPNDFNLNGETALMSACFFNELEMAALLMERGADVNLKNNAGETALFEAAENSLEMVERLVDRGADIHMKDDDGSTALMKAARRNQLDVMKFMVSKGASLQALQGQGFSLLWFAAGNGATEVVAYLLAQDIDPNMATAHGKTALMNAVSLEDLRLFSLYLGMIDEAEYTAKQAVRLQSALETARLLIERGADVNAKTQDGQTVLMTAVEGRSLDIVRLLLHYGADPKYKDSTGKTALDYAREDDAETLVQLLSTDGSGGLAN
jgi:ankyrin repeat protein